MKLPKTIPVAGKTYMIKTNKKAGGFFDCGKQLIVVGTRDGNERTFEILLHEVLEATMAERMARYRQEWAGSGFFFFMSHTEFENIVGDVAYSLKGLLK